MTLETRTERTITSVEALRHELAGIQERGYALSEGEHRPGVRSVGAPVFSYEGRSVAAICVRHYTPFGQPPGKSLIRSVVETAQQISYALGYGARTE